MNATLGETRREQIERVIALVADGMALKKAVEGEGLTVTTFHETISRLRDLAASYARAQEIRADLMVDEAIDAADNDQDAARARNRMVIRQWAASKLNTRKYGDRIDLNVQQTISINDARSAYLSRIRRPVSDQLDVSDAQLVDSPPVQLIGPADIESVPVEKPGDADPLEPDIFS